MVLQTENFQSPNMRTMDKLLREAGAEGRGGLRGWVLHWLEEGASPYRMSRVLAAMFPDEEFVPSSQTLRAWGRRFKREEEEKGK